MSDVKGVSIGIDMEDAVLAASVKVDIVEVLRELAAKSDNSIDDVLVEIVAKARGNADWKGYAKSVL